MPTAVDTRVPCDAASPGRARDFVTDVLDRHGVRPEIRDDAVLLVSEVVTNAVRHAHSDATIAVDLTDEHVRIGVTDAGVGWPEERVASHAVGGFGLRLLSKLSMTWGAYRIGDGKAVWFELPYA